MIALSQLALFLGIAAAALIASPATPQDRMLASIHQRDDDARTKTVTETETETQTKWKIKTVISACTGASGSKPSNIKPTPTSTGEPEYDGTSYNVEGVGKFDKRAVFTFETGIPEGLEVANYLVEDSEAGAPYDHRFDTNNVYVRDGYLNLKVPGVKMPNPNTKQVISSAEILTTEKKIKHASVRTNAIFDSTPGVCHGIFFYKNDNQETDIEYLSDPKSEANNIYTRASEGDPIPLWYSNQRLEGNDKATQETGSAPTSITGLHEYRIDWTKQGTAFYIDGVLQKKLTSNVPDSAGAWIWNNWANGDMAWSAGPPKTDNIFRIKDIKMYYNVDENDTSK